MVVWSLVFLLSIGGLNQFFLRNDSFNKYELFLQKDMDYDVLFFGTSHVMDAVYPAILYAEYGISSYNLGNPAETLEATYYTMKQAFSLHIPKVAIIDVAYIDKSQDQSSTYQLSHTFYDAMPLTREKVEAVWHLFPSSIRAEFLFPLISYHTRWEEMLTGVENPICECTPYMMGAELRVGRKDPADYTRTTEMDFTETPGKGALRRIIALCRSNGVLPILIAIPYPAPVEKQRMINSAAQIASQEGVTFLNLFNEEGLVNFESDCFDEASHLNPDGAVKITRFIGEHLRFLSHRFNDEQEALWQSVFQAFQIDWNSNWASLSRL